MSARVESPTFSIKNTLKGKAPSLPFLLMKENVLGKDYDLSFVLVGPKKIQELNNTYRGKNEPTDVLSFPLTENSGEIFLCPSVARTKAKKFNRKSHDHTGFLFIHGLLHLKGMDHGSRMEQEEQAISKMFRLTL